MHAVANIKRFEHEMADFAAKLFYNPTFWSVLAMLAVLATLIAIGIILPGNSQPVQIPNHFPTFGYPY